MQIKQSNSAETLTVGLGMEIIQFFPAILGIADWPTDPYL